jgi:hypothetical protein
MPPSLLPPLSAPVADNHPTPLLLLLALMVPLVVVDPAHNSLLQLLLSQSNMFEQLCMHNIMSGQGTQFYASVYAYLVMHINNGILKEVKINNQISQSQNGYHIDAPELVFAYQVGKALIWKPCNVLH